MAAEAAAGVVKAALLRMLAQNDSADIPAICRVANAVMRGLACIDVVRYSVSFDDQVTFEKNKEL